MPDSVACSKPFSKVAFSQPLVVLTAIKRLAIALVLARFVDGKQAAGAFFGTDTSTLLHKKRRENMVIDQRKITIFSVTLLV